MLISPSNHVFINIDEYFTMGLIKLPFLESIIIAINNVHSPLYYIILKCVLKFLTFFNIKEIHNEYLKEVVKKHSNKKIYQFIGSKEYKNLSSYEKSKTHYGNIIIHRLN